MTEPPPPPPRRPTHRLFSRSLSALDGYAADDQPPRLRRRSTVIVQTKMREWPRSAKWAVALQARRLRRKWLGLASDSD
ncbi:uncharacterized protein LOC62_05G007685 [Vanrija pseudolonga]|uniref:Uncharacterized protein n=1 Tax=Vanrija pseudolonga TaxID=143232 RepID=A0AAF1BPJ4_9TREE|nr:hypothetical protein LOC62_05G007685 [Vanrija pseudolonga]